MSGTVNEAVRGIILPFSFKYFHNCIQQDFSGQGQGWINHTRICNLFLGGLIVLRLMSNPLPPQPWWTTPLRPKLAKALISVKAWNFPAETNPSVIKVVKKYQIIQNVEIYSLSNLRPRPVWTGKEAHMRNERKEDIVGGCFMRNSSTLWDDKYIQHITLSNGTAADIS